MLILSILAFFAAIFLLAAITVAVAWMGFVKQAGEAEAAQDGGNARPGFRRCSATTGSAALISGTACWRGSISSKF